MPIFYVACNGQVKQRGIYVVSFDRENIQIVQHLETLDNPSYLVLKNDLLYASLINMSTKNTRGGVSSYRLLASGLLEYNENYASSGRSYVHLCVNYTNDYLFAANYQVGTTALYKLEDQMIKYKSNVAYHHGSKISHVSMVGLTPECNFVYSVDYGCDEIVLYRHVDGKLQEFRKQQVLSGSGPKELIFSQDGRFAYLLNASTNTVMVFRYQENGLFLMVQMISTVPHHFKGTSQATAIGFSLDGSHLFVSNSGHDSIAMYACNKETGKLYLLYMVHTHEDPVDFGIYDDHIMVVACKKSNTIDFLKMNLNKDELKQTNEGIVLPEPVCIVM